MLHYGKTGGVAIDVHVDRPAGRHGKLASKNVFRHGPFNDFLAMDGLYVVIAGANIDPVITA